MTPSAMPPRAIPESRQRPGRTTIDAVRVRLTTGRLLPLVPVAWSESGDLCIVRQLGVSTRTVRERRGFVVVHVRTGLGVRELSRLVDAQLLVRLLDRHRVWAFDDGDDVGAARAMHECFAILANFPAATAAAPPTGATRPEP